MELMKASQQERAKAAGKPDGMEAAGISPGAWRWLGPGNVGGRIRSIVVDPANASKLWVGSVGGGIWRTTDAGASWQPVNDFMANLAVSTMMIDPTNSSILYAGTGEGFGNIDALQGLGVFKSIDGGATWNQLANTNPALASPAGCGLGAVPCPTFWSFVNRLAISPNGNTILAGTNGGIARSTDGGTTWTQTTNTQAVELDFHPTSNTQVLAGELARARYSTDSGQTWTAATFSPAISNVSQVADGRVELAYAPSNPLIVYASVNQDRPPPPATPTVQGEIYRSTDGGQNFTRLNTLNPGNVFSGGQGWYDNVMWVNPLNPNFVIAGGVNLYASSDGGINWTTIANGANGSAHSDHHVVVAASGFDNTTNRIVYFGNDGGIYRTDDVATVSATSGWVNLNNSLGITQFYGAAANANGVIIGGAQDNGNNRADDPASTSNWTPIAGMGGDGGVCAADPTDPNYFYGEYINLTISRSTDGGTSGGAIWNGIADANRGNASANFIAPFMLDPSDPNTMLAGGLSLWRSANVKAVTPTWAPIKQPVPPLPPAPPPGATPKPTPAISALVVSPSNSSFLVAGHNDGQIYRTLDGGATPWTRIDNATTPLRMVNRLVVDNTKSPNWIYATFGGFSNNNVFVTKDLGTTWVDVSGVTGSATDLPAVPVRSLVINPANSRFLYVGTEVGVFASEDEGATWHLPQDGPANVSVDDLVWFKGDLIAVTHGRGIYTTNAPVNDTSVCINSAACQLQYGCNAGDWACPCSWQDRQIPGANDDVVISCPMSLNSSRTIKNLTVYNRLTIGPGGSGGEIRALGNVVNFGLIDGSAGLLRSDNDIVNVRPRPAVTNKGVITTGAIWALGNVVNDGIIALAGKVESNHLVLDNAATLTANSVLAHGNLSLAPNSTLWSLSSNPTQPAALIVHGDIHNDGLINSSGQVLIPTVSTTTRTLSGTGTWQLASFTIGDPYNPDNGAIVQLANDLTLNIGSQTFFDHDSFFISKSSSLLQNNHNLTIDSDSIFSLGFINLGTGALNLNGNYFRFFVGSGSPTRLLGTGTINLTATGTSPFLSISTHLEPAFRMLAGTVNAQLTNNFNRSLTIDSGATFNFNQGSINVFGDITVNGAFGKTTPASTSATLRFNGATLTNNGSFSTDSLLFNSGTGLSILQSLGGTGSWPSGTWLQIGTPGNPSTTTLLNDLTLNYSYFGIATGSTLDTGASTFTMPCSTAWSTVYGRGESVGNLRRTNLAACAGPVAFGNPFTTITFNSGTPPGEITMKIALESPSGFVNAIRRNYTITPTGGSSYTATLRLHYLDSELNGNDEAILQLVRQDGVAWSAQGASNRDTTDNWVESANVTQFSPWTLSSAAPPPPPTTFPNWQQGYFTAEELSNPAISGDAADPDGDGLSNLLEYAFHLDPKQPSGPTNRPSTSKDATYFVIIYTRNLAATDLTYTIEKSPDLITWSAVTPVNVILADDGVTQRVKAQVPTMGATKMDLRLRVTR